MKEITLRVERDEASGEYVASWDAPHGKGGIVTQGGDPRKLRANVKEAVACYYDEGKAPRSIRLRTRSNPCPVRPA